jgi:hypothetical protein
MLKEEISYVGIWRLFFMRSELEKMTQAELRAYVVANRQDDEAFHLWADRATANAPKTIYPPVSLEEAERIIRSKIEERSPGFLADREANSQPCSRTELEAMSRAELRAYIINHPKHTEAFHYFADTAKPTSPLYPPVTSVEEMERLVEEYLKNRGSEEDR